MLCQTITYAIYAVKYWKMYFEKFFSKKDLCWCLHNVCLQIRQNRLFLQASNRRFYKRQIDGYTSVDITVIQALNRRLSKGRINGWTSVKLTIVQASNRRLQSSNWRLYWLIFLKKCKIFRCPFNATVNIRYNFPH